MFEMSHYAPSGSMYAHFCEATLRVTIIIFYLGCAEGVAMLYLLRRV